MGVITADHNDFNIESLNDKFDVGLSDEGNEFKENDVIECFKTVTKAAVFTESEE